MFGALERLGYDVDALLASSGLRRSIVEDPDAYIPSSVCAGILADAQHQRRTVNLPLRLAVETPIGTNPLLDYLIVSSDSVGEGLRQLGRYLRIVNPRSTFTWTIVKIPSGSSWRVMAIRSVSNSRSR